MEHVQPVTLPSLAKKHCLLPDPFFFEDNQI